MAWYQSLRLYCGDRLKVRATYALMAASVVGASHSSCTATSNCGLSSRTHFITGSRTCRFVSAKASGGRAAHVEDADVPALLNINHVLYFLADNVLNRSCALLPDIFDSGWAQSP